VSNHPDSTLDSRVHAWIEQDPDPVTRTELKKHLSRLTEGSPDAKEILEELFSARLAFGTAGIRGPLGPGPSRMNRLVVCQTTTGLARFLRKSADGRPLSVVVGFDARTNSEIFAKDASEVLSGHGIQVILFDYHTATPVVAFAVRHLNCDAGIMITASHNPPTDNGYKVYLGGVDEGSQIIPPVDQEIEQHISEVAESLSWSGIPRSADNLSRAPDRLLTAYIEETIDALSPLTNPSTPITVVYTPLHGVGSDTFMAVLDAAGFPRPHTVEEQDRPDAAFPTVSFPNPEEKGALDLAYTKGQSVDADLIVAHDPDADRLAVAIRDTSRDCGYRMFTGNQLGAILGWWAAERASLTGTTGALANSLVSSPVLGKIAQHFGLDHVETLTGFKYVSRVPDLIFGFEEALGYLVNPDVVRDKDGISAALAILDLAQGLRATGKTLWDYLAIIEGVVGGFASGQITIKRDTSDVGTPVTDLLRGMAPTRIGDHRVVTTDDFLTGIAHFPKANILRYYLSDGSRVIVRPSGTEPKVKVYLDTAGATRAAAEAALESLETDVRELLTAFSQSA